MPRFLLIAIALGACVDAAALDRVRFATNWRAQAEHGGFYQAAGEGTYERFGLDVEIVQGGPLVNSRAQLVLGRIEFLMGSNLIQTFDAARQRLPTVSIAGFFQRDAHCLIAHPGAGNDRWEDLPRAPLLIGAAGRQTYFRWLKAEHGFSDRMARTYTFNSAPFLVNPRMVQQGYATAEPFKIAAALGAEPIVHLLADHGWSTYSTMLDTRRDLVESDPDLVRRFVDASILGWVSYLYGDPKPAHQRILRDNPDMPEDQLAYSRKRLLELGVVDSGKALTHGVGALDADRITAFLEKMIRSGLYQPGEVDAASSCDLRFVNHGTGLEEKARLLQDQE